MKVTITTPIKVGITVTRRFAIVISMASPSVGPVRGWRAPAAWCGSGFHKRAVVDLAVEPVDVAGDVLLRGDVEERLEQRNARHFVVGLGDEARDIGLVFRLVAGRGRRARAV